MTDQHPLHPKLIDALSEYRTFEEAMQAAADWRLRQVIKAWEQCMKEFEQKLKAMRPQQQQENN